MNNRQQETQQRNEEENTQRSEERKRRSDKEASRENKEKYRKEEKPGMKPKSSTQRGVECSSNDAGDGPRGEKERKRENGRRGKQNKNKQEKGNREFAPLLTRWAGSMFDDEWESTYTQGHDLWHKPVAEIEWENIEGAIMSLNMGGWGEELERKTLWNMLARTKTMVAIIIDHRQTKTEGIEYEMRTQWTGAGKGREAKFKHAKTNKTTSGGITVAVHPIIARYTVANITKYDDPRGWGRWTSVVIHSKTKTIIIGTYGPTGTGTRAEEGNKTIWHTQLASMNEIRAEEREATPRQQYMRDIGECIGKAREGGYEIILIGDINIPLNRDKEETEQWR